MPFAQVLLIVLATGFALVPGQNASTGRIKGRVLDLLGTPIPGAEITIAKDGRIEQRLVTGDEGVYQSSGLPASSYLISASLRGFKVANRTIYLGPGEEVVVELGLQAGALGPVTTETTVTGTVLDTKREGVNGATITIVSPFNEAIRKQIPASSRGRFELKIHEPGQYVVYASKPRFTVNAKAITVSPKPQKQSMVVDFELSLLPK